MTRDVQGSADQIGLDRKLTITAVNQNCQGNGAWPTIFKQGIDCCPGGSAGLQYVIDQNDMPAFHHAGKASRLDACRQTPGIEVIAMKPNIQNPDPACIHAQTIGQLFGNPQAAGQYAD
jgi:hypothetical protein